MNTPETDAELIIMGRTECDHYILANFARRLERERDEARAELENLKAASIHTCHDQTPTPETDAEIKIEMTCACYPNEYVSGDFARKLERERDEARQQNVKLQEITEKLADELCDLHACFRRNLNEFYELKEEAK